MQAPPTQSQKPPPGPAPAAEAPTVNGSVLEGMFVRALNASGPLKEELKAAGFDIDNVQLKYTVETWHKTLAVARRRIFPSLSQSDGNFQLGKLFIEGFLKTMVGRLIGATVAVMGPDGMIDRSGYFLRSGRSDAQVTVQKTGEKSRRVSIRSSRLDPDFVAGCMAGALIRAKAVPICKVVAREETRCEFQVDW